LSKRCVPILLVLLLLGIPAVLMAQEAATPQIDNTKVGMDTMWTLITAFLVFFMNLGFALVESGLCRAKNCVNILFKNYIVFAVSSVAFLLLGFGLRQFSMHPAQLPTIKQQVLRTNTGEAHGIARRILRSGDPVRCQQLLGRLNG